MLPARALATTPAAWPPGVERLAVTAEIVLGADGEPRSASFYRSRIRSDHRLSYDQLDEFFAGRASPPEAIAAPLELARSAAAALRERRSRRALEIERSSPSSSSTPRATWSPRTRSSRPRRMA